MIENENELSPEISSEAKPDGSIAVKRNKVADFIAKIVCLLLAFFLWFYASSNDNTPSEETFTSIPVKIVNHGDFSVLKGDDVTVDVKVSGKRSVINRLRVDDIVAFVDISEVTEAGKHTLNIEFELPNGVTLEKSDINAITLQLDKNTTVKVPVKVEIKGFMQQGDYEVGVNDVITDVKEVELRGPAAVLNEIDCVRMSAEIGQATQTIKYRGELVPVDKNGVPVVNNYVTLSVATVTATIPVYKYRNVPVSILFSGGGDGTQRYDVSVSANTVRVCGDFAVVDLMKLEYTVNEAEIVGETVFTFEVKLPSSVRNVSGTETVTVTVCPKA
jgi:YbbR domain-containing protein